MPTPNRVPGAPPPSDPFAPPPPTAAFPDPSFAHLAAPPDLPDPDWTSLSPPLRALPPPRRGRRPAAPRTDWGRPDPLDPALIPARPWQPLSDEEWEILSVFLWAHGCGIPGAPGTSPAGRRMADPRARLDAIFRGCTMKWDGPHGPYRAPWRALPAPHGRPDTVSRTHRRWAHAGLWRRLLQEVTDPAAEPALRGLAHWICCAYRRAIRVMGLRAVLFARRLGQASALPAPTHWLPRPDLLGAWRRLTQALLAATLAGRTWQPPPGIPGLPGLALLRDRLAGRRPLPRWAEPA